MAARDQLPLPAAVALGLVFAAVGIVVILLAAGVIGGRGVVSDTPRWVGVSAGLVFLLLGATVVIGFVVAGGAAPDGDLLPGTPIGVRLTQYLLGLAIVGLMTGVFGWIAFGPGPRQFTVTGLPFLGPRASEMTGRVAFGIEAGLMAGSFIVLAVVSARRLRRAAGRAPASWTPDRTVDGQ